VAQKQVMLASDGDEIETELPGGSFDAKSDISHACCNKSGNSSMGKFFVEIAGHVTVVDLCVIE